MTINEIKYLLEQYGIRPSKSKGQNFLINKEILKKIVAAADLKNDDNVLEIGPGLGILTEDLIKNSKKVLSVELDKRLIFFLKQKFAHQKNLEIFEGDILRIKNSQIANLLDCQKAGYKVVANLPYNITKPVLRKFLTYEPRPKLMVVLVQKEVAQKITAKPGEMSLLSLSVQLYGQPEIIGYVGKENFYPQPKVDSAILKIVFWPQNLAPEISQILDKNMQFAANKFWQMVKFGFSSPRKQLQNNLSAGFKIPKDEVILRLKTAKLSAKIRAQDLALSDWLNLYQKFVV
ncbi:MAG: 16S rRNA (adenine(1518)-N(6)/adenine(1519)-N(6))-dimethyltransferase RsmA [Patescibacteria group bacterium]